MSSKERNVFATFGYMRQCSNEYNFQMPTDIIYIIVTFYGACYKIYAQGWNHCSEFGLSTATQSENSFTKLESMSKLAQDPTNIYYCGNKIFIRFDNTIYAAGDNQDGRLGLKSQDRIVKQFTPIQFPDMDDNDYIDIISNGHDLDHMLFITHKSKIIYGVGDSTLGRLCGYIPDNDDEAYDVQLSPINCNIFNNDNVIKIECGV
eukprot:451968_1